jgi:O-antigen/teichoic acid export membrane protein
MTPSSSQPPVQLRLGMALTAVSGFLARASTQLVTVVITLVATRFLDPTEFGVFALASIAITLIRTMLYTGAFEYILKAKSTATCATECLLVNLLLSIGLSLLLCSVVLGARAIWGASAVTGVILALAPSNLISALGAWKEALLIRSGKLKRYYALNAIVELLAMGVAIALLFAGFKVYALVGQIYARNTMLLLCYLVAVPAEWSERTSLGALREVLAWTSSRYASVLLNFGANYGADVFLGVFLSPAATGLYRASSRLVTAASDLFSQPARLIAMAVFSARAAASRPSNVIWPHMFAVIVAVGWSALAGLATISHPLVPLALGEQWRAAASLVPILCLARAFAFLDSVTGTLLVAYDHQRVVFYQQAISSILLLVVIAVAAPFGVDAAAIAVAAGACISSLILAALAFQRTPGSWNGFVEILPMVGATVTATGAGAWLAQSWAVHADRPRGWIVAAGVSGGIIAWLIALALFRRRARMIVAELQGQPSDAVLV